MRKYQFNCEAGEKIMWSMYINWIDFKGSNRLIGRVSRLSSPNGAKFVIEYFEDCVKIAVLAGFGRISGCPVENGLVFEFPYDMTPLFIEERMLNPRREDLTERLNELGLSIYDRYEFFKKTGGVCSDNNLFLAEDEDASSFWHEVKHGYFYGIPKPSKL